MIKPTFVSIDQEIIRSAIAVCSNAIVATAECLSRHDLSLGRTTQKNKQAAEQYEAEIAAAKECRDALREAIGWPAIQKAGRATI